MTAYQEMKQRYQSEVNAFPLGFCFSNKQFEEMMNKWSLTVNDTDKILSIGAGGYIRKSDREAFSEMLERQDRELKELKQSQKNVYDMFVEEMFDLEYGLTWDKEAVLDTLGISYEDFANSKVMQEQFAKAHKYVIKHTK